MCLPDFSGHAIALGPVDASLLNAEQAADAERHFQLLRPAVEDELRNLARLLAPEQAERFDELAEVGRRHDAVNAFDRPPWRSQLGLGRREGIILGPWDLGFVPHPGQGPVIVSRVWEEFRTLRQAGQVEEAPITRPPGTPGFHRVSGGGRGSTYLSRVSRRGRPWRLRGPYRRSCRTSGSAPRASRSRRTGRPG